MRIYRQHDADGRPVELVRMQCRGQEPPSQSVIVQPESGLDITNVAWGPWPWHSRAIGHASPAMIRERSGTLFGALSVLPAWNTTTLPGYDELTGLHAGLSGLAPTNGYEVSEGKDQYGAWESEIRAQYDLSLAAITGNVFSQSGVIDRMVSLSNDLLVREDVITTNRACYMAHLEHPNIRFQEGDRVLLNLDLLSAVGSSLCFYDRDGQTPEGMNIFRGASEEVFHEPRAERCFLLYLKPNKHGAIPVLVRNGFGSYGLGFVHYPPPDWPTFTMVWFSPMCQTDGVGVGSIEFASTLPLGARRNHQLKLLRLMEKDERAKFRTEVHFLSGQHAVREFAREHDIIVRKSDYPKQILPDRETWSDTSYDPATNTFDNLRRAAGIKVD